MFSYISGILTEKNPTHVVIDVNGIGYEISIPFSTYGELPETGSSCRLLTHFHVREDIQQLYGFHASGEKELFMILISVSGIGPKSAIGILSSSTVDDFKQAILLEDLTFLSSMPGIGKKTAQRLVVELKEKISKVSSPGQVRLSQGALSSSGLADEAVMALMSLGYSKPLAEKAVMNALRDSPSASSSLQELIKYSLRILTGN